MVGISWQDGTGSRFGDNGRGSAGGTMNARHSVALALAITLLASAPAGAQAAASTVAEPAAPAHQNAGHYERIKVHGASLEGNLEGDSPDREVSVYLPPSYEKRSGRRYPVLYLLHGFTDSDARWFGLKGAHFVNVPTAADAAFAAGVHHLIIVMPDAFTKYQGSMYSSSVVTGDWERFITEDLVNYIDTHYRTIPRRESRGLAGHSMGGYGTLRIGMKHPHLFAGLYAMSPCCMGASLEPAPAAMEHAAKVRSDADIAAADFPTKAMLASAAAWSPNPRNAPQFFDLPIVDGKVAPDVVAAWAANAPLSMVHQYVGNLKSYEAIAVDAGDRDEAIAPTVRKLDDILTGYGVDHVSEIYSGDHVSGVAKRLQEKVLPFFDEHLKSK
jgi:enterochelin esterase-like enzyme